MTDGTWLALAVLVLFAMAAAAMVTRVVPALLALPVLAVAIALVAAGFSDALEAAPTLGVVLQQGSTLLAEAMVVSLLGGTLSFQLHKSGVAERIVKSGAELFGEDPLVVSVLALLLVALLFTTIGGLGAIVLVAMISPFRAERAQARERVAASGAAFIEVFVDTPLEVAESRDTKGLYARARRGELSNFTGVDSPYEPPPAPELRLDGASGSPQDAAERVVAAVLALRAPGQGA